MFVMRWSRGYNYLHLIYLVFIVSVFTDLRLHVYMLFVVEIFSVVISEAVSIKHFSCLLSGLTTP
jgi:hypothetical protein